MKAALYVIAGAEGERRIDLNGGKYTIGRSDDMAIQIDSRQVSRRHAEIHVDSDTVRVIDCGSANGTLINGSPIVTAEIRPGDRIQIGDVTLEMRRDRIHAVEPTRPDPGRGEVARIRTSAEPARFSQSTYTVRPRAARPAPAAGPRSAAAPLTRSLALLLTVCFAAGFLTVGGIASFSFRNLIRERLEELSLQRAQDMVAYLAERNREDLRLGNELLLDVESVIREKGVRRAFVINAKGRVVAPIANLNEVQNDPFTMEALSQNSNRPLPPSPAMADGTRVFAHPIRAYNDRTGTYETLGAARMVYSPEEAVGSLSDVRGLALLILLSAAALAVGFAHVLSRLLNAPLLRLAERIHQWRTGMPAQRIAAPFREWNDLYEAVDRAVEEKT